MIFLKSSPNTIQCPKSNFEEIAFIGRSNVGKSSLINMLFNNKNLAKISKRPGKTKLINHFIINDTILLADLPGYGYAKLSKVETKKINEIIQDYIENRKNLTKLFLLIDIRHEPIKTDLLFIDYLDNLKRSFHIIFTKSDKLKKDELLKKSKNYIKNINSSCLMGKFFISSSYSKNGKEEILNFIIS
ncbi:MAG: YihA family ribosome biogenesis GTP-binding protein [Cryomorphaceae bacterium]|nr:MAG: YihA family ribosome biogenesis GTP-binding protein [Cryomorphaceae bacterium]